MAADEQQAQQIIAIAGAVEPLDQLLLGVVEVRQHLVGGQRLEFPVAPSGVERSISSHQNEPRCRVARRPVLGPILQGAQAGFLVGLFGRVHVPEVAQ